MTTAQALLIFDVLQDQYGAPYFPEDWKLKLLNMAQLEVLNRMVPDSAGGVINFEFDQNVIENISKLIINVNLPTDGSGNILYADIQTAVRTNSSDPDCTVFRFMSLADSASKPIKFVKENSWYPYINNVFKTGDIGHRIYRIINQGGGRSIQVSPIDTVNIALTVMKSPKIMTSGNTPDWDDYMMNQVILQALKLAGIAVSGTEEIQNILQSGIQSGQ